MGKPERQPQAGEGDGEGGEEDGTEVRILPPPRRNPRYDGVGGAAASSAELAAQASLELAMFAKSQRQQAAQQAAAPRGREEAAARRQPRASLILLRHPLATSMLHHGVDGVSSQLSLSTGTATRLGTRRTASPAGPTRR
jgi:hypothetical protein